MNTEHRPLRFKELEMKKLSALLPVLCLLACLTACVRPQTPKEQETVGLPAIPEPTEAPFSALYYERDPGRPVILDGLAVTKETYGQVMGKDLEKGIYTYIMKEGLRTPTELRYGYSEIALDEVIDESRSYTVWVLLRPYSMYAFSNVFLKSGDKLMMYYSEGGELYLSVDHGDADTRSYCAVLVFIA